MWRERALLTQEALARRSGLSVGTIRGMESGRIRRPRGHTVRLLAEALALSDQDRAVLAALARGKPAEPAVGHGSRSGVVPAQLPPDVAGFTGRAEALRVLDDVLSSAGGALVPVLVLVGGAGVGKTALAVRWAHRAADRFPDGQLYLNLHGYADDAPLPPLEALSRLMSALGVPADRVPVDVDEATATYRSLLAGRKMLLVLDNAAGAHQVRALLPGGGGSAVLVTSRDQLRGLTARDGARRLTVGALSDAEALSLLSHILGAERVNADLAAAEELAQLCARIPLALRIAAANLASRSHHPVADYVARLRANDLLATLAVAGDPHSAVLASFDLSYLRIPAPARRMFRLLSLAPGPDISAQTAAVVADTTVGEAQRLLDLLAGAHLVEEHTYGRYVFHDLLRRYAADRAGRDETASDRDTTQRRLYDYYLSAVDAAARVLYPEKAHLPRTFHGPHPPPPLFDDHKQALAWLDTELPCLLATIEAAGQHGPRPTAWLLADALRGYFWLTRSVVTWLTTGEAALAAAQADGDPAAQAAARLSLADANHVRGRYRQAAALYELAQGTGQPPIWAAAVNNLGWLRLRAGQLGEAADCYQQLLEFNRRMGASVGEVVHLGNLASVYHLTGRPEQAVGLLSQAWAISRKAGIPALEAGMLEKLGHTYHALGRLDQALVLFHDALPRNRMAGDRAGEAATHLGLAAVHRDLGQPIVAPARTALALARDLGDSNLEAEALNTIATIHDRLGQHRQAIDHHVKALAIARQAELRHAEVEALIGLAAAHLHLHDHAQTRTYVDQATTITRAHGYQILHAQTLTLSAAVHLADGDSATADELGRQALAAHRETGHRLGQARTHLVLSRIHRQSGDTVAAQEHRRHARALLTEAGAPDPGD
ncbi:tetratricopeptide repeat protein [Micromonospora sp. WMMD1082]|nr:tetratricopeptide repeat protein [Micromonospora sp. WMMD1082]MDG4796077.1 tetratricopeptide repeat protein [Micromonospora sp. WMMD1082]